VIDTVLDIRSGTINREGILEHVRRRINIDEVGG